MLSRLLREFLLTLAHFLISLYDAFCYYYKKFRSRTNVLQKGEVDHSEIKLVLYHVPKMSKKVQHLVVMSDSNNHQLTDLARLVIWSLVAGIPFISFYDITGNLKEKEENLFLEVEKKKKGIPGCIKWINKPNLNGYTNGAQSHTITINIFSRNNGQETIAQCIRRIGAGEIPCDRKSDEMTAQELDKALSLVYPSMPEPDLVLYSGPLCCTYGLLPWQIRLTEFLQLSLYYEISVDNYLNALYKYSKCDQRFGK